MQTSHVFPYKCYFCWLLWAVSEYAFQSGVWIFFAFVGWIQDAAQGQKTQFLQFITRWIKHGYHSANSLTCHSGSTRRHNGSGRWNTDFYCFWSINKVSPCLMSDDVTCTTNMAKRSISVTRICWGDASAGSSLEVTPFIMCREISYTSTVFYRKVLSRHLS